MTIFACRCGNHCRFSHGRMLKQNVLNLRGRNWTASELDQILDPVHNDHVAVAVLPCQVAGAEPAISR
jgi:hypothetical protein